MKHQVSELTGALLDAAVANAEGWEWRVIESESPFVWLVDGPDVGPEFAFSPSTNWTQGGPIIERERIELQRHACSDGWWAGIRQAATTNRAGGAIAVGGTPLIAAMRAFVASRFGDHVDLVD